MLSSLFAAIEEQLLNGSPPDSVRRVILCIQQKMQSRREDCKRCFNRQDYHRSGWLGVGELVKVVDSLIMFPGQIRGGLSHDDRRWITAALSLWVESRLTLPAQAYAACPICFFYPNNRLGHQENYAFSLSQKTFYCIKASKEKVVQF